MPEGCWLRGLVAEFLCPCGAVIEEDELLLSIGYCQKCETAHRRRRSLERSVSLLLTKLDDDALLLCLHHAATGRAAHRTACALACANAWTPASASARARA